MILDKETASKKLKRIALEIAERNHHQKELILIGIKENGIVIARIIEKHLKDIFSGSVKTLELSMNKNNPSEIFLSESISFDGKAVLLIDDVANSGKTILYALKPIINQHPSQIETAVLVERTYKKFPVAINYVGISVSTSKQENIIVDVNSTEVLGAHISKA
jgi:pyrimidine operon attenuation protein/uracil phosphoribosyltransferase